MDNEQDMEQSAVGTTTTSLSITTNLPPRRSEEKGDKTMPGEKVLIPQEQLQLWKDFLKRWPRESIAKLTLEQYVLGGNQNTFCHALEYDTKNLGALSGNAYKYGIFKCGQKTKIPDNNDSRHASDRTYAWVKNSGLSAEDAFKKVKDSIVKIIEAASHSNFDQIDALDAPLFPIVKWKIAFLYQSQNALTLLPIYKADMLSKLANLPVGTPVSQLQKALMSQKPASMSLLEYYDDLLQKRTDVFGGDKKDNQSSQHGESNGIGNQEEQGDKLRENSSDLGLPRNLIYFGAPGTGKSYKLKETVEGKLGKDGKVIQDDKGDKKIGFFVDVDKEGKIVNRRYERVTFFPTYSYAQFVGCYKPVMEQSETAVKKSCVEEETKILGEDELARLLKKVHEDAKQKAKGEGEGIIMASILSFAKQHVASFNKVSVASVVEKARIPNKRVYGATISVAEILEAEEKARTNLAGNKGDGHEEIAYKFVPGPFLRILVKALNNPKNYYCLVIEEINRANAAAVFGDVFQLLDRSSDNVSEYDIAASKDVKKFLYEDNDGLTKIGKESLEKLAGEGNLKIPHNMYIWATMNSADQGVFPMDTAFKRRWEFEYVGINDDITDDCKQWEIGGTEYKWNNLRVFINGLLSLHNVNEDKLMGPWFVKPEKDGVVSDKQFKSKVLMYLWEDAARMCRAKVFADDITTFSDLRTKWESGVSKVFECDSETLKKIEGKITDAGYNKDDVSKILKDFGYNPAS